MCLPYLIVFVADVLFWAWAIQQSENRGLQKLITPTMEPLYSKHLPSHTWKLHNNKYILLPIRNRGHTLYFKFDLEVEITTNINMQHHVIYVQQNEVTI